MTRGSTIAAVLLGCALAARGEDGMATTLRFEAAGDAVEVQADPTLGTLVQVGAANGTWTRTGEGQLLAMAAGWTPKETFPSTFTTSDGRRYCLSDHVDAASLLEWREGRWQPAAVDGPKDALFERSELRRGAVRLGIFALVRADDGTDLLVDGFGVFVHHEGAWTFAPLQRLDAPPIRWERIGWCPSGDGVAFCAGERVLLGRAGRLEAAPTGVRPDPALTYTRLRDGAWLAVSDADVAVVSSAGAVRFRTQVRRAQVLAYRRRDDAVLLQGSLVGASWVWAELGVEAGTVSIVASRGDQRDPRAPIHVDDDGALWSDDRCVLRRWSARGVAELPLSALLVGVDPGARVWFSHGSGLAFSLERAELDRELDRPREPLEVVEDVQDAATLDEDGRLRVLRLVACDPPDDGGAAVHQRRVYRFHVRRGGAWIIDETSPEYVERFCSLRWCQQCHGGAAERVRAPRGGLETRPPGALDPEGHVVGIDGDRRAHPDPRALVRRPDGSEWVVGPAGLVELERVADGRYRPRRLRLGGDSLPWIQDADGDVWLVAERQLTRVAFP